MSGTLHYNRAVDAHHRKFDMLVAVGVHLWESAEKGGGPSYTYAACAWPRAVCRNGNETGFFKGPATSHLKGEIGRPRRDLRSRTPEARGDAPPTNQDR